MRTFSSIEQIEEATRDGSFEENHYLEAKTILKTRSSSDKDELARDLAQFAFDGGTVVFGVSEDKSRSEGRFAVNTFDLPTNVREQLEQIALERCQPPLSVRVRELRSDDSPGKGCIVVEVPPSSRVPHMVAGKYPSRGDSTRRYLNDAEVRMWIVRSEEAHERVSRELQALVARDPYVDQSPRAGHLFGVALPLTSRHEGFLEGHELHQHLNDALNAFATHWRDRFDPADNRSRVMFRQTSLSSVSQAHPRSGEAALRSQALFDLESGGDGSPVEERLAEWSMDSSGGIRIYDAGLSVRRKGPQGNLVHAIWSDAPVEMLGILVESARLSGERIGYHGQWGFGVAWTGLRGAQRHPGEVFMDPTPVVDRDEGSLQHVTSSLELQEDPAGVLDRLARPILRMIGDEDYLVAR